MWNAEDSYNRRLQKNSFLTYCHNVLLMVHVNDLFWYITRNIAYKIQKWALKMAHLSKKWARTIFSTSEHILLRVQENDLFWYITINIQYEILKWDLKRAHLSQKWGRTIFSTKNFWPHFIASPWKRYILIYHNHIQYEIFKTSSQIGSIEL